MTITPVSKLVADAEQHIEAWTVEQVKARLNDDAVQLVDIRDVRELWREGTIPGAFHAPRGLLEFWVDPQSPYAKDIFQQSKTIVLFCGSGWRSALAAKTLKDMGLESRILAESKFDEKIVIKKYLETINEVCST